MNEKPITQSSDIVLRSSYAALRRAAQRARERALQTGTRLVVSRSGKLCRIAVFDTHVAEAPADYDGND